MLFRNRADAGRVLAGKLRAWKDRSDVIVLALPRGGVPVGFEVARHLHAPLDVFVVRKIGAPGQEEFAIGAIATGGVRVINAEAVRMLGLSPQVVDALAQRELRELERRERVYRGDRPPPPVRGRAVILVDDGLATGSTMRAAAQALRQQDPTEIIIAVPVAPAASCEEFRPLVDDIVCAVTPEPFFAVGQWYADFSQTTDDEVHELLESAGRERQAV